MGLNPNASDTDRDRQMPPIFWDGRTKLRSVEPGSGQTSIAVDGDPTQALRRFSM